MFLYRGSKLESDIRELNSNINKTDYEKAIEPLNKKIYELEEENRHLIEALESIYNSSINLIRSIENDYIKIIIPKKEPQAYFVDSICCPEILDYDEVNIPIKEHLKEDLINNMNYYKEKYNLKENTNGKD